MKQMKANFEIKATRQNGTQTVFTLVCKLYNGVAADIYDRCEKAGYTNITVRMI